MKRMDNYRRDDRPGSDGGGRGEERAVGGQSRSGRGRHLPSAGRKRYFASTPAEPVIPTAKARLLRNAVAALASGLLLYFLVSWLEQAMGTDRVAAVFIEEACKFGLLMGFAALEPKLCPRKGKPTPSLPPAVEGLVWGFAAIVVFAATENLAYFAAFPGDGIFLRLVWSEPVHLVSALAEAEAVWLLMRIRGQAGGGKRRRRGNGRVPEGPATKSPVLGMLAGLACFLAVAVVWHVAFNLAANGPIQALERSGDEAGLAWRSAILGALIANLAALAALGYHFAHRVIVGGFLYGPE